MKKFFALIVTTVIVTHSDAYAWPGSSKYAFHPLEEDIRADGFYIHEDCAQDCPKKVMILSLDGGGIKGIILARILEHVECKMQTPIHQLFDVIAGTSTGGLVAAGLTIPAVEHPLLARYTSKDIVGTYLVERAEIFKKNPSWRACWGFFGPKYDGTSFSALNQHYYGAHLRMDALVAPVVLTAYDCSKRKPFNFSSLAGQSGGLDYYVWQAARASAAAPIFFAGEKIGGSVIRDGCLVANNPSFVGYKEARKLFPNKDLEDFIILSIGTGQRDTKQVHADIGFTGVLEVVGDFIYAQMEKAEDDLKAKFGENYHRIQPIIAEASADLDNISDDNVQALMLAADMAFVEHEAVFDKLAEIWKTQQGRHESAYHKWQKLKYLATKKLNITPEEFTTNVFMNLCERLELRPGQLAFVSEKEKLDDFSYEVFFKRLASLK